MVLAAAAAPGLRVPGLAVRVMVTVMLATVDRAILSACAQNDAGELKIQVPHNYKKIPELPPGNIAYLVFMACCISTCINLASIVLSLFFCVSTQPHLLGIICHFGFAVVRGEGGQSLFLV